MSWTGIVTSTVFHWSVLSFAGSGLNKVSRLPNRSRTAREPLLASCDGVDGARAASGSMKGRAKMVVVRATEGAPFPPRGTGFEGGRRRPRTPDHRQSPLAASTAGRITSSSHEPEPPFLTLTQFVSNHLTMDTPEKNSLRSALSAATNTPRRPSRGLILAEFVSFSRRTTRDPTDCLELGLTRFGGHP
jgi:hypothetical protein